MAHEPHRAQVEHDGGAAGAHGGQRRLGRLEQRDRVVTRCVEVRDAREVPQHGRRPAPRRTRADADAVVLADEENWAGAVHVREVRRRVEGARRRGVVDRRVAEAGDDERVLRPRVGRSSSFASPSAKPSPTARGRWEAIVDVCGMTCSRACPNTLWRPPEIGSDAEQVEAAQRLANRVDAPVDVRAGGVERTRAVVQQGRVGGPRQQAEGGVRLVPGRADRVVARPSLLEPPRGEVEVPALGLGLEERLEPADRDRGREAAAVRRAEFFDGAEEVLVDGLHGY